MATNNNEEAINPLQTQQNNTPTIQTWTSKGFVQTQANPWPDVNIAKETPILDNANVAEDGTIFPWNTVFPDEDGGQITEAQRQHNALNFQENQKKQWIGWLDLQEAQAIESDFNKRQSAWKTKEQILAEMRTELQWDPKTYEKLKNKYLSKPQNIPWTPENNQKLLQEIQKTVSKVPNILNDENQFRLSVWYDQMADSQKKVIDEYYKWQFKTLNNSDTLFKSALQGNTIDLNTPEAQKANERKTKLQWLMSLNPEQLGSKFVNNEIIQWSQEYQDLLNYAPDLVQQANIQADKQTKLNNINDLGKAWQAISRKVWDVYSQDKTAQIQAKPTALDQLNSNLVESFNMKGMTQDEADNFKFFMSQSPAIIQQTQKLNEKMWIKNKLEEEMANIPAEAAKMMWHDAPKYALQGFINQRTREINTKLRNANLEIAVEQWALNALTDERKTQFDMFKTFKWIQQDREKFEYQKQQDAIDNRFKEIQLNNSNISIEKDANWNPMILNKQTGKMTTLKRPWYIITSSWQQIPFSEVAQADVWTQKNSLVQFANENVWLSYKLWWDGKYWIDCSWLLMARWQASWLIPAWQDMDANTMFNKSTQKPLTDLSWWDLIYYKNDKPDANWRYVTHVWIALWPVQNGNLQVLDASTNAWWVSQRTVKVDKDGRLVWQKGTQIVWADNFLTKWGQWQAQPQSWPYNTKQTSWYKNTLPATAVENLAVAKTAIPSVIKQIEQTIKNYNAWTSIWGYNIWWNTYTNEWSKANAIYGQWVKIIGKFLEWGKLAEWDQKVYEKLLPNVSDSEEVANSKIQNIKNLVKDFYNWQIEQYWNAKFNVSDFDTYNSYDELAWNKPSSQYQIWQTINQWWKTYKIVWFDTDWEPLVE